MPWPRTNANGSGRGPRAGSSPIDGLDWRQAQGGSLVRLPRIEPDPLAFTHWRFHRASGAWQAQERGAAGGFTPRDPALVTTAEPPVTAIAWTDAAVAQLGTLAGGVFTPDPAATPAALGLRYKPDALRILDGGIPAPPRLPAGASDWRYLAREEATPPTPTAFPAWTREGRLLPPPDAAAAPLEGRFLTAEEQALLDQVFTFNPAARVTFRWRPRAALSVIVRLERAEPRRDHRGGGARPALGRARAGASGGRARRPRGGRGDCQRRIRWLNWSTPSAARSAAS